MIEPLFVDYVARGGAVLVRAASTAPLRTLRAPFDVADINGDDAD